MPNTATSHTAASNADGVANSSNGQLSRPSIRSQNDPDGRPYLSLNGAELFWGDSGELLRLMPGAADCCVTSPPYWQARNYFEDGQLGHEKEPKLYVERLIRILEGLKIALKPQGSLWLNIGDAYRGKNLQGIPWRVVFGLQARGWILRNEVIWHKKKHVPSNAKDRLALAHEQVFHFVTQPDHYYDLDAIRDQPLAPTIRGGRIVTPTGVSGVKYKRQLIGSRELTDEQRKDGLRALEEALEKVRRGEWPDFRMLIKGTQRVVHGGDTDFSGRAWEVENRGFALLPYHPKGSVPTDVWDIQPEDEVFPDAHFAVYPEDLCTRPILATCPPGGTVIDPFVGSGTTLVSALRLHRRGIGIDLSSKYLEFTAKRIVGLPQFEQAQLVLQEEQAF